MWTNRSAGTKRSWKTPKHVLQKLNLPYRVVAVCTGDLGQGQVAKYDIETWMPSRNSYGETHSASRFYDFQARRLNLRYRDEEGKVRICHTLNNTVIASPRVLIPIMELSERGWKHHDPGGAAAVHGRAREDRVRKTEFNTETRRARRKQNILQFSLRDSSLIQGIGRVPASPKLIAYSKAIQIVNQIGCSLRLKK